MIYKALMLGSGHSIPARRLRIPGCTEWDEINWTTLDHNPDCNPHVLFDLNNLEIGSRLPFNDGVFDEIHAYEVLEHFGKLGDYRGFFNTFGELWRILKTGGYLSGTCPSAGSQWAFGDPGHTRVITLGSLSYLTPAFYANLGISPATDYLKEVGNRWWNIVGAVDKDGGFSFVLSKMKVVEAK